MKTIIFWMPDTKIKSQFCGRSWSRDCIWCKK